jgi:hypothetical protein
MLTMPVAPQNAKMSARGPRMSQGRIFRPFRESPIFWSMVRDAGKVVLERKV